MYSVCMWKLAFVERSLGTFVAPVPSLVQYPSASTRQAVRSGCESYIIRMANTQTSGPAKLGYVIMYVPDVEKTVDWYSKAFGLSVRRIDDSRRWAEMETGSTTLAFTPLEQREADITGGVKHPAEQHPRANIELNLLFPDLDATFKHVLQLGAKPVTMPEEKPWAQKAVYIEDLNGNIIRLGSEVAQ